MSAPVVFRPGGTKPWLNEEPPRRPNLRKLAMILTGLALGVCACSFVAGIAFAASRSPETTPAPPTEMLLPTITTTSTPSDTPVFTETATNTAVFTLTATETSTTTITPSLTVTTTPPYATFTATPVEVTVIVTVMSGGGGGGSSGAPVVVTAPPVVITSPPVVITIPVIVTATPLPDSGLTGKQP